MKRYRHVFSLGAMLLLALLLGLILGGSGTGSGLWKNLRSWLGSHPGQQPVAPDPALQASLPLPDPAAGLPPCALNDLLKPGLTPQEQTSIIGQMLIDYWTSLRSLPNGTWSETCDQLAGANPRRLSLVPREHPALGENSFAPAPSAPGIRLHVISSSGCVFQLIHDGPDGMPYTDDDLIRNFPPDLHF